MINIKDMEAEEIQGLLRGTSVGHLGCVREGRPYVVPMHYAFDGQNLYFLTTEGMKTEYLEANPQVCFQVEMIDDAAHWRSVVVMGRAERLSQPDEMERAIQLITGRNPALTPALSQKDEGDSSSVVIYRIRPDSMDGRKAGE
jgi:nitroimidazol reductase NimA-like FMN-containing flavoprotein (pyridoxamine 5'-phosphate oxidase superfamily)